MLTFTTTDRDPDIIILGLNGELDPYSTPDFVACVEDMIEKGHRRIIVDCADLKYVSSVGLGALVRVHARMKKLDGDVKVTGLRGPVADVFRITMLFKVFSMFESIDDAVADFE